MLGTVRRAGDLLDLFDGETAEWGATGVSRELRIAKSQAHELLVSLHAIGLLRRSGRGRFRLGWRMVALGDQLLRTEVPDGLHAVLEQLSRYAQGPSELVTFDGRRFVRVASAGDRPPSARNVDAAPHCGAAAKILLSTIAPENVDALFAERGLPTARPGAHASVASLHAELDMVRDRRLALDRGETDPAWRGVAAPVHGATGPVVAAVGLLVPTAAWERRGEQHARAIRGAALLIERGLLDAADPAVRPTTTAVAGRRT